MQSQDSPSATQTTQDGGQEAAEAAAGSGGGNKNKAKDTKGTALSSYDQIKIDSEEEDEDEDFVDIPMEAKTILTEEELRIRNALLDRRYHLPGYNYWRDLFQYITNTHPVLSIFCHHPLHPVKGWIRLAAFFGSLVFGLALTNIIYLGFVIQERDYDHSYVNFEFTASNVTGTEADVIISQFTQVDVTSGMIALWTIGSALNALYDNTIWALATCSCFLPGGRFQQFEARRKLAPFIVMFLVVGMTAGATMIVLIVATLEANEENEKEALQLGIRLDSKKESYRFLLAYFVELCFSLVFWYPVIGLMLFSGVLDCFKGRLPVFGGRPRDIRLEQERAMNCQMDQSFSPGCTLEEGKDDDDDDDDNNEEEAINFQKRQQKQKQLVEDEGDELL